MESGQSIEVPCARSSRKDDSLSFKRNRVQPPLLPHTKEYSVFIFILFGLLGCSGVVKGGVSRLRTIKSNCENQVMDANFYFNDLSVNIIVVAHFNDLNALSSTMTVLCYEACLTSLKHVI